MEPLVLTLILLASAVARLWFLAAGVPHAVGIDEPQVVDRALRILRTGSWNTHLFDYPTLVIYLHASVQIVRFLWGALHGEWASLDAFSIEKIYLACRAVTAVIGVATVWLTWRLARDLASRGVALLAAAELAVRSLHVRESHYALTDVPLTALTTLALWLAVRAARLRTTAGYAWAGAACGLAAAAKYNGGVAMVAVAAAWFVADRTAADRWRKAAAGLAAAAAAFLVAAPYTLLDLPSFLDGFAAQFSRFAGAPPGGALWLTYVKHLSPAWSRWWVPLAIAGAAMVLARPSTRRAWAPVVAFAAVFFYVLASHAPAFGRYALPLLPPLCILTASAAAAIASALAGIRGLGRPVARHVITVAGIVLLVALPAVETVAWLDALKRPDTRTMAADWLKGSVPHASRIAVENSGPTYLDAAGFRVIASERLLDHPIAWYRDHADLLVISASDLDRYESYVNAGPTVFQVEPTPQRWGPPIRVVEIRKE
ncbi:MAG TPA: glycosyltransferase family 39 protein [Vicinamibacterales bacterium]